MLNHSLKIGLSFGLTSAVITTLGLIVGLYSGTGSKIAIVGGILTIAIADAFSDALGIHVSEESECKHTTREIWESTLSTFLTKFFFALTFIVPVILLPLKQAVIVSVLWGIFILGVFSYYIAREQKTSTWKVISEHIIIALVVIAITHFVGLWIKARFS